MWFGVEPPCRGNTNHFTKFSLSGHVMSAGTKQIGSSYPSSVMKYCFPHQTRCRRVFASIGRNSGHCKWTDCLCSLILTYMTTRSKNLVIKQLKLIVHAS